MLIKQLFRDKDYAKTLRRRLWLYVAMCALGAVLIAASLTLMEDSGLPDFVQGFYLGSGSGLVLAGAFFAVRTLRVLGDPEALRREKITEGDERGQAIVASAMGAVFWVMYFLLMAGLFVALPLNRTVFYTLLAVFAAMSATFFAAVAWYKLHM